MPTYEQLKESRRVQQWLGINFDWTPVSSDTDDVIKLTWKSIGTLFYEDWEMKFRPNTTIIEEKENNNE